MTEKHCTNLDSGAPTPGFAVPNKLPFDATPEASGLYDPAFNRDSCGLAVVATLRGKALHEIIDRALGALCNLEHRGAVGVDPDTGDGAGIMTQLPDEFFRKVCEFELPKLYAAGNVFLPQDSRTRRSAQLEIQYLAAEEGLTVLGWRQVPVKLDSLGKLAQQNAPHIEQLFLTLADQASSDDPQAARLNLERRLFRLRRLAERKLEEIYFPSLSSRTIVYKGMVTTPQLGILYPDLQDETYRTKLAVVHSRFSTNTFPSWSLAQPFRYIAHNGEINTIRGNRNWSSARQSQLHSPQLGDLSKIFPICTPGASDSASFDEVAELLHLSGRSLPHVIMMMIPEAWEKREYDDPALRDFYAYHSLLMQPWDGPANMVFSDGEIVGATLDRNGLRSGRWVETTEGLVILSSEIGVSQFDPAQVVRKGRLQPSHVFLIDTAAGRIIEDQEIKQELAHSQPWGQWLRQSQIRLEDLPEREPIIYTHASVLHRQRVFGYTEEEINELIAPMALTGQEPLGAMGSDTPFAAISGRPRLLFDYFVQQFAQVTNPPLDAVREERFTSLATSLGPEGNLLALKPDQEDRKIAYHQIPTSFPVIDDDELAKIRHLGAGSGRDVSPCVTLRGLYRQGGGAAALEKRLEELCAEADQAIANGAKFLVLSDRNSDHDLAPVPSLLMLSAVHHHLIRQGTRMRVGMLVEAGDVREVHHVALLVGYGAGAVNPYLALETCEDLVRTGRLTGITPQQAVRNLITALGKGVLKVMSKMGISTVSSYTGAQCFEAVGLDRELISRYFTGTESRIGGSDLEILAIENESRHNLAYSDRYRAQNRHEQLPSGGEYRWRRSGAAHSFSPESIFRLQQSTRSGDFNQFAEYTRLIDEQNRELLTLRGLIDFDYSRRDPLPLDEVEPTEDLMRRFATGAMSFGSLSREAHELLAVAMNRLGGKSNTGEGGEETERLLDPQRRSSVKQVASGRFGVTSMYLVNADDIQIKLAQGAKPGEGGQLPPDKVYPEVARARGATPGVGLISPPPHHDIYSIEDLKQLIFDLKRANPKARIHVKLVSQSGIGAVSVGCAKAKADVILVSGHDGGTGASPLTSLKHAGLPWEIGLAEVQRTLMVNRMRDRVVVQVDGQLKTGRDVVIAALLGAEEFGFSTAPLVVSGCIMMRVCHKNTCPVGIATQDPQLRSHFTGQVEHVINFFRFIAEQVRQILADLGFATLEEAIGRSDMLIRRDFDSGLPDTEWGDLLARKARSLDLSAVLAPPINDVPRRNIKEQDHELAEHFDAQLIQEYGEAVRAGKEVRTEAPVQNTDRAIGTMLGNLVTLHHGAKGLADDTVSLKLFGCAGQSLGAFLPAGITLDLLGEANDYVGKGLSGGQIVVRPATSPNQSYVIAGNAIGYGATGGRLFIAGKAGERFLVRNSGVQAVVEGVGDHALEYMTGGAVLILGSTGQNLAAGMSGGIAYLLDYQPQHVNPLAAKELLITAAEAEDQPLLLEMLTEHSRRTGSILAKQLLENSEDLPARFTRLVPITWQQVTQIRQAAYLSGEDPDSAEVWQRISEVVHG